MSERHTEGVGSAGQGLPLDGQPNVGEIEAGPGGLSRRGEDATGEHKYALSSVSNAVRLLCAFGGAEPEIGVSDLARRLGLGKSTVHRLLHTLAEGNFIERNPYSGRYRLGLKLYELGTIVSSRLNLHEAVVTYIDELRDMTGETVQVGVLDGMETVFVERRESTHTLRFWGRVGHRVPAHCTSTGKAILAFLDPEELDRLLGDGPLQSRTPHTITDPDELRRELETVRELGYARNISEAEMNMESIGAPIRDDSGAVVAAISVVGPALRFQQPALRRLIASNVHIANAISTHLGYRRSR